MNTHVPFARCLRDYLDGDADAAFTIEREDGVQIRREAREFLRTDEQMPSIERQALDLCRGRVLDVGAGAGPHALLLQARGLAVVAVDFCEEVVELLHRRGIVQARCSDIYELEDPVAFDTILVLGRTIGLAGDLPGLARLFRLLRRLCADDGQLLLTSLDVMASGDERMRNHGQRNRLRGLEPGQQRFRFRYRDVLGGWIDWLHVDPQSLGDAAAETGWRCQVVADEGNGNYLARLSPEISSPDRARS